MKIWIDDIRDPNNHLSTEDAENIIWAKEWWEAKNCVLQNSLDIEVIHFDNFLGDPNNRTGSDILSMVMYRLSRNKFPKLSKIYLHSSDESVVNNLFNVYNEKCNNYGIELIKNPRPNRT